ncbi:MAG: DUF2911 domain-containing protein [Lewinella sp.]|nr:DUF2911 domain-containing protein [Lewinella sp.]
MKLLLTTLTFFLAFQLTAQITLPPSGDNQQSIVTQYMGAHAHVTVNYHSPDVTGPNGQDRRGHIWGELVPFGLTDLGFGLREPAPWRAGANENTVISFSHDVAVEGQPLPAGDYGLHLIVRENEPWTVIFSHNASAWGSFFYRPEEDALRVDVSPVAHEYTEWLTYEFTDRQRDACTLALRWEEIELPIHIAVPNNTALHLDYIRGELENEEGFMWQNFVTAVNYCLTENTNLEEALGWAETAISTPFIGQRNFTTLSAKAQVLMQLERMDEAQATLAEAIAHPTADPFQIHGVGRQLISQGHAAQAMKIFQANYDRFDGAWPTEVGMARGLSALGEYAKAAEHARIALTQAPDDLNRGSLEQMIQMLSEGKDVN